MKNTVKRVISAVLVVTITVYSPQLCSYTKAESINASVDSIAADTAVKSTTKVLGDGTYYISNIQYDKVVQIDNNASSSKEGAILELWDRDNKSSQKWMITDLNNGYYAITSSASKMAITAPSSLNGALTQEKYTGKNTQQWCITYTSDNMFKLSPKSNLSYYMAAGDGIFTSKGRNVEMRSDQSDHKDEWYLLDTTKRYAQISLDYSNSASFNKSVKQYYEKNAQAYGTTYTSINKNTCINELKNSNYFGGMMHGGEKEDKLKISSSEVLYLSDISSLPSSNFNSVKVVVLTSCYSGRRNGFVDTLCSKGVDVVVGFSGEVEQITAAYWTEQFICALSMGSTVKNSMNFADMSLRDEYGSTRYSEVMDLVLYNRYTGSSDLNLSPCK